MHSFPWAEGQPPRPPHPSLPRQHLRDNSSAAATVVAVGARDWRPSPPAFRPGETAAAVATAADAATLSAVDEPMAVHPRLPPILLARRTPLAATASPPTPPRWPLTLDRRSHRRLHGNGPSSAAARHLLSLSPALVAGTAPDPRQRRQRRYTGVSYVLVHEHREWGMQAWLGARFVFSGYVHQCD